MLKVQLSRSKELNQTANRTAYKLTWFLKGGRLLEEVLLRWFDQDAKSFD